MTNLNLIHVFLCLIHFQSIHAAMENVVEPVEVVYVLHIDSAIHHHQPMVAATVLERKVSINPVTRKIVQMTHLIFVASNVVVMIVVNSICHHLRMQFGYPSTV